MKKVIYACPKRQMLLFSSIHKNLTLKKKFPVILYFWKINVSEKKSEKRAMSASESLF